MNEYTFLNVFISIFTTCITYYNMQIFRIKTKAYCLFSSSPNILSKEANLPFLFSLPFSFIWRGGALQGGEGEELFKVRYCSFLQQILSFRSRILFERVSSLRDANRKSQNMTPLKNVAEENIAMYQYTLRSSWTF